ncbi:hypothetical protein [Streptomyces zingiberis]|uniref:Secreted protein n=1 Tax=Streptomyces zingiberis TaxID=2053010 RepID=A0ABX1BZD3_9ACTN|nr:hypothetical protein [Streptomyces zingiberis]NJQ01856.1 hypothetical protein [Streptomyces zingiberis]
MNTPKIPGPQGRPDGGGAGPRPSRRVRRAASLLAVAALCGGLAAPGASAAPGRAAPGDAGDAGRAVSAGRSTGTAGADGATRTRPQAVRVVTAQLGDDRKITVTAVRSRTDRYAATLRLAVLAEERGRWVVEDRTTVGERDGWFWFPLTGEGAVCSFSASDRAPEPITLSLLVTPSIGCSQVYRYEVVNGEIVPV